MSTEMTTRNYIAEFRKAFAAGIESIVAAATVYVEAIEDDPRLKDKFRDEFADTIPPSAWSGFEAVGKKWMHPKLLMGGGGQFSSKIKRLPYSDQERIFSGARFDMLTADGDTLKVDLRNITREQGDQMFDGSHVRTLAEQKAYLESRKASPVEVEVLPYTINGGRVSFRRGVSLSRAELKRLVQEM